MSHSSHSTPYFYVMSDPNKVHVTPTSVPVGTVLVYVTVTGMEIPIINAAPTVLTGEALVTALALAHNRNS